MQSCLPLCRVTVLLNDVRWQVDSEVLKVDSEGGSTAVVLAVTSQYVMVANAGDSRAVMFDGRG